MDTFKILLNKSKKKKYLLSIIIPFKLNESLHFEQLLEYLSDFNQNDCEFIFVDDGSNNEISNYIARIISKIRNYVFIRNNINMGVSSARNIGILNSKGKYLLFIDSDDLINCSLLSTLINYLKNNQTDNLICLKFERFKQIEHNEISFMNKGFLLENYDSKEAVSNYLYFDNKLNDYYMRSACGKIFKKQVIINNNIVFPEELNHFEDSLFVSKYCQHIAKIELINSNAFYYYRMNQMSASKSFNPSLLEQFSIYCKMFNLDCPRFRKTLIFDILYIFVTDLIKNFYLDKKKVSLIFVSSILKIDFVSSALKELKQINVSNLNNKYLKRLKVISSFNIPLLTSFYVFSFNKKYMDK